MQTHRVKDSVKKMGASGIWEQKTFIANLTGRKQCEFQYVGKRESLTSPPLPPLAVSRIENCDNCLTE